MNINNDKQIQELNENLVAVSKSFGSYWLSFAKGVITGFGSILGAGLAIILIGWFLNVIGVIPAFQATAENWRNVFIESQNNKSFVPTTEDTGSAN